MIEGLKGQFTTAIKTASFILVVGTIATILLLILRALYPVTSSEDYLLIVVVLSFLITIFIYKVFSKRGDGCRTIFFMP
jgi:multisubunit Na+/H+ antiporter MnhF subunit